MNEFIHWHQATMAEAAVTALNKNHFSAMYAADRAHALNSILDALPPNASIGIGGSWTVSELGLPSLLEERGHTVLNHNKPGLSPEEVAAIRKAQLTCDVFLTSTNAITMDGKLVNMDGVGNRVAAMMFGPKQVIIVAGINKLVPNVAAAEERIANYAAPLNNKRLNRPNPCTKTGICMDCQGPTRICNITTIMHKRPPMTPVQIVLIGEPLGY